MTEHHLHGVRRPLPDRPEFDAYFDPRTTVVVSIDMHEGHLSESPQCPCPAPRGREIIEAVDTFHARAREVGVRVIHVRSELRASGIDDVGGIPSAWRAIITESLGPVPNLDEHAIAGTEWTTFRTAVEPGDEIVTGKKRLSAFYPTDLDFLLRQLGVTTVVLNGIMTDCCVLNTAFDASNRSYRVIVPPDLTRGTDPDLEAAALSMVSLHLGLVIDSDQVLARWNGGSTTA